MYLKFLLVAFIALIQVEFVVPRVNKPPIHPIIERNRIKYGLQTVEEEPITRRYFQNLYGGGQGSGSQGQKNGKQKGDIEEPIRAQNYNNLYGTGRGKRDNGEQDDIEEPIVPQHYNNLYGSGRGKRMAPQQDVEEPITRRYFQKLYKREVGSEKHERVKRLREDRVRYDKDGKPWKNAYRG